MRSTKKRDLLALVPRVEAHPTHAVVDGVTYPGGLAQYRAEQMFPSARPLREEDANEYRPEPGTGAARVLSTFGGN